MSLAACENEGVADFSPHKEDGLQLAGAFSVMKYQNISVLRLASLTSRHSGKRSKKRRKAFLKQSFERSAGSTRFLPLKAGPY